MDWNMGIWHLGRFEVTTTGNILVYFTTTQTGAGDNATDVEEA